MKNANAKLPDSGLSYEDVIAYQNSLHVPGNELDSRQSMITHLDMRTYGKTWNDREIMQLPDQREAVGMSQADIAREEYMKQQNAKMSADMSDEQKEMLAHIEDYVGKSKLIDESVKPASAV